MEEEKRERNEGRKDKEPISGSFQLFHRRKKQRGREGSSVSLLPSVLRKEIWRKRKEKEMKEPISNSFYLPNRRKREGREGSTVVLLPSVLRETWRRRKEKEMKEGRNHGLLLTVPLKEERKGKEEKEALLMSFIPSPLEGSQQKEHCFLASRGAIFPLHSFVNTTDGRLKCPPVPRASLSLT